MSRYVYEADKVNTSLERLQDAYNSLNSTEAALNQGFAALKQARGANNIDFGSNQTVICGFPGEGMDYINELRKAVEGKKSEIEDYNNAPWWKKLFSSIGLGVAKFTEGLLTAVENIGDACISLVGFAGGLFNKDFQNACAEVVKYDAAGNLMSPVVDFCDKYSWYSKNSAGAKILEGVGTAVGYIAIAAATGGAAAGLSGGAVTLSSTAANTIVAGIGGLGAGTEKGLLEGKTFNQAFGQGIKTGAVNAGMAYVGGKIGEKLQATGNMKNLSKASDKFDDIASRNGINQIVDEAGNTALTTVDDAGNTMMKMVDNGGNLRGVVTKDAAGNITGSLVDDVGNVVTKNSTSTIYDNKITRAITDKADDIGGKAADKFDDIANSLGVKASNFGNKVTNSGVYQKVANSKVAQGVSNYADDVVGKGMNAASATGDFIKTAAKPLTNMAGKVVGKVGEVGAGVVDKVATVAAKSNIVGQVATVGLATAPSISDSFKESALRNNNITNPLVELNVGVSDHDFRHFQEDTTGQTPQQDVITNNPSGGGNSTPSGNVGNGSGGNTGGSGGRVSASSVPSTPQRTVGTTKINDIDTSNTKVPDIGATTGNNKPIIPPGGGSNSNGGSNGGSNGDSNGGSSNGSNNSNKPGNNKPGSNSNLGTVTSGDPSTGGNTIGGKPSGNNHNNSTTSIGSSGTSHGGGGYSTGGYSFGGSSSNGGSSSGAGTSTTGTGSDEIDVNSLDGKGTLASSISSTKSRKNETIKINSPSEAIQPASSKNNYVIPTAAALSASAAAGIGAKAYMDHKKNNTNEEEFEGDENNGYTSEEWNGSEDDIKIDYGSGNDENSLDEDDDYAYSADSIIERYEAANRSELEEVQ